MLRFIALFAILVVVLLGVVVWVYPSNRDFGPENPFWNGLADFCSDFDPERVASLAELPSQPQGTALVLIPYETFTVGELERLEKYAADGGTLILLDDYGYGNEVLSHLDITPRFTNDVLLDPLFNFANSYFPKATYTPASSAPEDEGSIVFNHGSTLTFNDMSSGSVLAWSSRFSYLDENDNSVWDEDEGEAKGPLPIAYSMIYESGHIVLVSDPSILIMLDTDDNLPFFNDVITIGHASPALILDESHLPPSSLDKTQGMLERTRSALATPQGVVGMVLVALLLVMIPIWRRHTYPAPEILRIDQGGDDAKGTE